MPSWLDIKLGIRMLFKNPGLTLAGGAGIAVAVAIAAGGFSFIYGNFTDRLPLEEGTRIVSLEMWDSAESKPQPRIHHDYLIWRDELKSIHELSAFRNITPNLILPAAQPESIRVAAITASGFRVARVRPLIGRYFEPADEHPTAPAVLVISETAWRNRFAADPAILKRTVQLGATPHSIIGVMPQNFAFPVNHHFWVPLRLGPAPDPMTGVDLYVFGRLAPGATIDTAQAELNTIGRRAALTAPKTYARLQPRLLPYAFPFVGLHEQQDITALLVMQAIFACLLVLVCLNIAILVYTRTAMRHAEISLRTALGASRSRIVIQLFIESLVLSAVAALAGVGIAAFAFRQIAAATVHLHGELPFWISFQLEPEAVLYAAGLSILAAAVVGLIPALQATRRDVLHSLRIIGAGGSGMRLGKTWTVLIVAQVCFAVALLPPGVSGAYQDTQDSLAGAGFAAHEYLTAQLGSDTATPDQFAARQTELIRRLEADPRIAAVTFAQSDPGNEPGARIQPQSDQPTETIDVRTTHVDIRYFQAFQVPILAGRGLEENAIVVNQSLANKIFAGNALGRRIRYVTKQSTEPDPWFEITGIVADFPTGVTQNMRDTPLKIYHPAKPGQLQPATLAIHLRNGDPSAFTRPLRDIAAAVDPSLHLRNIRPLDEALRSEQWISRLQAAVLLGTTLSVLLLSSMGIYALMSFTVSQRRKEIGIRMALGASRNHIVAGIFSRAFTQLALGATLGIALGVAIEKAAGGNLLNPSVVAAVSVAILAVGFAAAFGPARRSLTINPSQTLRDQ